MIIRIINSLSQPTRRRGLFLFSRCILTLYLHKWLIWIIKWQKRQTREQRRIHSIFLKFKLFLDYKNFSLDFFRILRGKFRACLSKRHTSWIRRHTIPFEFSTRLNKLRGREHKLLGFQRGVLRYFRGERTPRQHSPRSSSCNLFKRIALP